jgi:hypothetical protein
MSNDAADRRNRVEIRMVQATRTGLSCAYVECEVRSEDASPTYAYQSITAPFDKNRHMITLLHRHTCSVVHTTSRIKALS